MKTFKRMLATILAQTVLLSVAVVTGHVAVTALPVVIPMALAVAYWMSR